MIKKEGTLYGVGVGPGDPELITLKAIKALRESTKIFAASSSRNEYSIALNIVKKHIDIEKVERLGFPMTRDRKELKSAWEDNAKRVLEVLAKGENASFITLGDPLTYSTFGYLLKTVKKLEPGTKIRTIPGITSYNAAAAKANTIIVEGEESCYIVSGAKGGNKLKQVIEQTDNVVILKTYRYFNDIYRTIKELDLSDKTILVSRCGLEGERVVKNLSDLNGEEEMPYLSLVIINKNKNGGC